MDAFSVSVAPPAVSRKILNQLSNRPPGLPLPVEPFESRLKIIGKPIRPSAAEIKRNPRARSAILRIAERTEVGF